MACIVCAKGSHLPKAVLMYSQLWIWDNDSPCFVKNCTPTMHCPEGYAATKLSNAFTLSSGKSKQPPPSAALTFPFWYWGFFYLLFTLPFLIAYKHSNRYSFCWNVQVFPGLWSQLMYHLLLSLLSMVCKQPSAVWNSVVASTNCQRWVRKTQICYHPAEEKTCLKFA